ncbi:His-Xaa-Ser system radical SAM maturase HxsB [Helicobacter sp. 16-1353]|uniref:His-Xaa-Ser system radical SAM maturase HxsB n=1 Tax=Helicobacter sp. 16-1353 TaxID=2004996 RepID=UPI000DCBC100|nr:His-Xaa-Ser system radical SAM maturase HxsB [Helicobacter sp. 16-1353]RAX54011.1 His-Xaa-Ser system radical SAM maturase HxsB [Helicobacter sp. 16-1353]
MSYKILPFNFDNFGDEVLLTGMAGDFYFLKQDDFNALINYTLDSRSQIYFDLKSKNFIADSAKNLRDAIDMTATRYRSKKGFLREFTNLHMMVITVRCNQICTYCQASCEEENAKQYDMSPQTAFKIIDLIFNSPSQNIKIEFQGGESMLNWQTIESSILYAEEKNKQHNKNLEFVICTNLTTNIAHRLDFIKAHNVLLSTSLDGNESVHNRFRIYKNNKGTYETLIQNLKLAREQIGSDKIGALMTTTSYSLDKIKQIIDEYVEQKFDGIFLRSINPYGFAEENKDKIGYHTNKFIDMYVEALEYILELNKRGIHFVEYYTNLLLSRILTPFPTGFVDLQSPSGAGISGVIYDYNGDVYPADEGRMLAKMGDKYFLMGNVYENSYSEIFNSKILKNIVNQSCLEILPICSDCVFSPYCGADPVRNYLETKDIMGDRIDSAFCQKNKAIFNILFSYLRKNDKDIMDIFYSWITRRDLKDIQNENY